MGNIRLQVGDVFVVNSRSPFAKIINDVSSFWSSDNTSLYNHAGIILSKAGDTFEALRRLEEYNLSRYEGRAVMIVRPEGSELAKKATIETLEKIHRGQIYPAWRLPLHLFPPLARRISYNGKWVVCSELVAKYLYLLGRRHPYFTGTTPDRLADEWRYWKGFTTVYQGVWA